MAAAKDPAAARLVALQSLLEVATPAVTLQPAAERIIDACAQPGDVPAQVARRGGRIASGYCQLHGWALDLIGDADRASLEFRVTQLLHYHAEMIDTCLKLAFPKFRSPRLEQRRLALRGLGEPARTLRDARAALALWISDLERTDGVEPPH
ncbi:hypothetical protein SK803_14420 [Lentzea sp. BCCO 10_0856]|uniref:HEAT repeat domain-containing protein n=1 Tax=Lentzea miocenica TaxID=3095431 RepID=A0ABU4T0C9_9PSEU|nr:hypothetical protein [Lentzea sp. BCCO 10_0856]MDX8031418.1 hypothetical protein [Lentzea sp. BCCO 10_0856]